MKANIWSRPAVALFAVVAVVLGLVVQAVLGAPSIALIVQSVAVGVGAIVAWILARNSWTPSPRLGLLILIGVLAAIVSPLVLGPEMQGARRWIAFGPLTIQPSVIALPFAVWAATQHPTSWLTGLAIAAMGAALAVQMDAAASSALALAWLAAAFNRSPRLVDLLVASALIAAAVWSWAQPDTLPSVAYVEHVVANAMARGTGFGLIAGLGVALVIAPLALVALSPRADRSLVVALTALWIGLLASSFVGNYPTPIIGYGGSAALGWLISLGLATACLKADRNP